MGAETWTRTSITHLLRQPGLRLHRPRAHKVVCRPFSRRSNRQLNTIADPSPTSSHYPSRSSGVRRLPPTPGSSSATTSPTTPYSMPEPEPYSYPSARPGHFSTDSYTSTASTSSNELLKKATTSSTPGRRLPTTPGQLPGTSSHGRPPLPGLPSDPRPSASHHILPSYPSSSSINSSYPPEKVPYDTEDGGYSSGYSPAASRVPQDSGAGVQSPQVNVYNVDEGRVVNNGHYYSQSQPNVPQQYSAYNHASSYSLGVSQSLHKSPSREYMMPQPEIPRASTPGRTDSLSPCRTSLIMLCFIAYPYARW